MDAYPYGRAPEAEGYGPPPAAPQGFGPAPGYGQTYAPSYPAPGVAGGAANPYLPPSPGGYPGYASASPADFGVAGATASFFVRPLVRGLDVSAARAGAADTFCRSQGLRGAIYADRGQRAARAIGPDGRMVGPGPVLRDVLCRR